MREMSLSFMASGLVHLAALLGLYYVGLTSVQQTNQPFLVEFQASQITFADADSPVTSITPTVKTAKPEQPVPRQKNKKKSVKTQAPVAFRSPETNTATGADVNESVASSTASVDAASTGAAVVKKRFRDVVVRNVLPVYPRIARRRGWTGKVLLRMLVDQTGKVRDVEVLKPSKYTVFNNSAKKAASGWQFRASSTGQPYLVDKEVVFQLL